MRTAERTFILEKMQQFVLIAVYPLISEPRGILLI